MTLLCSQQDDLKCHSSHRSFHPVFTALLEPLIPVHKGWGYSHSRCGFLYGIWTDTVPV